MVSTESDVSVVKELVIGQDIADPGRPQNDNYTTSLTTHKDSTTKTPLITEAERPSHNRTKEKEIEVCKEIEQVFVHEQNWEYKECASTGSNVKGRLKQNINFWQSIGAPDFIISVINNGYMIPFTSVPEPRIMRNNRSAELHGDFVEEALTELISTSRILECEVIPSVVNPLSVSVQNSGKKRLILDLRYVNNHLQKQNIKYEDWKIAMSYFTPDSYMFTFDLKSGYHHVDIYPDHQSYLGFSWTFRGSKITKYFKFTVLPFGLSTAPHIFTKLLKPLLKHWRHQGVCLALYLDDGWGINKDKNSCKNDSNKVRTDLDKAGFIANHEKSEWNPTQSVSWLGFIWHSQTGKIELSQRRLEKITATITKIIDCKFRISARSLASFTGQIISTSTVTQNISRIMTRHCSMTIATSQFWDIPFELDDYCKEEILYWNENLPLLQSRSCFVNKGPHILIYSDASSTGCGAFVQLDNQQTCHKLWDTIEAGESSTWRELTAIKFSIEAFLPIIQNTHVKWYTDSQTAAKIVEIGSMKLNLHRLAISIFRLCLKNHIILDIQWIPRSENHKADYISRIIDTDDWQITDQCFRLIEHRWGPHTVDAMANYYNTKIPKFFSRYWNPHTSGVDFFVQNLNSENCLIVPPVSIIAKTLHYLHIQNATASLVVPFWQSSTFWPLITHRYWQFVRDYVFLDGSTALTHGRNRNSLLGSADFRGDIIAIRLKFY